VSEISIVLYKMSEHRVAQLAKTINVEESMMDRFINCKVHGNGSDDRFSQLPVWVNENFNKKPCYDPREAHSIVFDAIDKYDLMESMTKNGFNIRYERQPYV